MTSSGFHIESLKLVNPIPKNTKVFGFYFSASYCGPCKSFTPEFAKVSQAWKNFEIIFVSLDEDESSFIKYYKTMPPSWNAIRWKYRDQAKEYFNVRSIPTLVIVDSKG